MIFGFSDYTLDTALLELRCQGQPVRLRAKPFDVLAYLLEHRDRAVSKQELFEELWPDVVVGDATLNSCIKEVRQALGDTGAEQRIILTLRGRGYRVIGQVEAGESANSPVTPAESHEALTSEHKLVTVLACQLTDAPRCYAGLDADERHRILQTFMQCVEEKVRQYGGTVHRTLETGVLALFGAPTALEAHARHAVLAAEEIRQRLGRGRDLKLPEWTAGCVSMGLDCGRVVISGSTPDRITATSVDGVLESALGLQHQAPPGAIVLSEAVERLARRFIRVDAWDACPGSCVLVGLKPLCDPWSGEGPKTLSRFVGRDADYAALRACLSQVQAGRGQVLSVVGEPGVGKSRLLHEFRAGLGDDSVTVLGGRCQDLQKRTPYAPVLEILRNEWDLQEWEQDPEAADLRIRDRLQAVGMDGELDGPILRELLGIGPRSHELAGLDPSSRKQRCFDLLRGWLEQLSARQPVLMEIEDLQWIDPTSEEWLRCVVPKLTRMRLMVLVTFRPGYSPSWMGKSYATQVALAPLPERHAEQIARQVLARDDPDPSLLAAILRRAEGNPLFIEELARRAAETGMSAGLPDTLEAVLAPRVDQLSQVGKHVLRTAAVIGRITPEVWLEAVSGTSGETLYRSLAELESAELLVPAGAPPRSARALPHALIQEAVLQALPAAERKRLHRRIADVLEAGFPEAAHGRPEILGQHLTQAGLDERAVPYWHRAGQRAIACGGFAEAIEHLNSGIAALQRLPESAWRHEQEIALQASLAPVWTAHKGLSAPALDQTLARMQELGARVLATPLPAVELMQLFMQRKLTQAKKRAKELLADARARQDEASLVEVHFANGFILLHLGETREALHALEQTYALYDPERHRSATFFSLGIDPAANSLSYAGLARGLLGYLDQGRPRTEQALALAEKNGPPMSVAAMYHFHLIGRFILWDLESIGEVADKAVEFSERHGLATFLPGALLYRSLLRALARRDSSELPELRRHWGDWNARNGAVGSGMLAILVAAAHLALGSHEDGMRFLAEALPLLERAEEWLGVPELHRLEGELRLAQPRRDAIAAEGRFERALRLARQQHSKLQELRAAMSLCRLFREQGNAEEARQLLEPVYRWFTEGFDKPDMKEAGALLEALRADTTGRDERRQEPPRYDLPPRKAR